MMKKWNTVAAYFPSFSEGLSLRFIVFSDTSGSGGTFPFLFGGAFIEVEHITATDREAMDFPSFSEGLSLRW